MTKIRDCLLCRRLSVSNLGRSVIKKEFFMVKTFRGFPIFPIQYKLDSLQDITKCMALNGLMYMVCENHELIIN